MLILWKIALGPILLAQGKWLRRTALRLSEAHGPRFGSIAGYGPEVRLLFVGDSSCAGVGVDHQSEALAYQVAQIVARRTQLPIKWQLVARTGVNSMEALKLVRAHELSPAHIVVTALGVNDVTSQRNARRFIESYRQLISYIKNRTGAAYSVISGLPPLHVLPAAPQPLRWYLGQCARKLDVALSEFCNENSQRRFVSLQWAQACNMARDKFHPGISQYAEWARQVSDCIVDLLQGPMRLTCRSSGPA